MFITQFCYEISEKAELTCDDQGNPGKGYLEFTLEHEKEMKPDTYERIHAGLIPGMAKQYGLSEEWIKQITVDEHRSNANQDDSIVLSDYEFK